MAQHPTFLSWTIASLSNEPLVAFSGFLGRKGSLDHALLVRASAVGADFELKGGSSLSKGFRMIDRFSEDIDIRIEPPAGGDVKTGRNQIKSAHIDSRRAFYDGLA